MRRIGHILMLTRVLPHHAIGGMQAIAWDLARIFVAEGYRVTVVTPEIAGHPSAFVECGVQVLAIRGVRWRRVGRLWWGETRRLFHDRLASECDIVLSVSSAGFGLLDVRKSVPQIPFVMQAHGTSVGEFLSKWRSPTPKSVLSSVKNMRCFFKDLIAYRKFDAVIGVGPRVAEGLRAFPYRRVLRRTLIRSIPNGIDCAVFRPDATSRLHERARLGIDLNAKVVVSASRLHVQKGVGFSLAAFAVLATRHPDVRYLIVGDGPERSALANQAASLGIAGQVMFAGAIPRERLASLLTACDVMLFTSTRVEGLALNVLEALACGIPAVMSDHLYDARIFGPTVLPVSPADAAMVAAALERAWLMKSGESSRLPEAFSLTACARAYLNLFEDLAARRA